MLPHHTTTRRSQPFSFLKRAMSAINCSARSMVEEPVLTLVVPVSSFTQSWLKTAGIGLMAASSSFTPSRSCGVSTPARLAAE